MIRYQDDLTGVDWEDMKATLHRDNFDNGRSPTQLEASFHASYATCVAYDQTGRLVGTARALSDGICNAYIVDVWTHTPYRHQGIATRMMDKLLARLPGQHVSLFSADAQGFYEKLGFAPEEGGLSRVVGRWLDPHSPTSPAATGKEGAEPEQGSNAAPFRP